MKNIILTANGTQKADLVLKNASIVNVFTESIEVGDVAITDGKIVGIGRYEGKIEKDMTGRFVCPGFIDGHIHLESSMVTPSEFARAVIAHGTTAVITDPHEIANVAGCDGITYMMQATKDLPLDVFFMVPSCVPATDLDESGACLNADDITPFYNDRRVLGLAEMMNAFGVNQADGSVLSKIKTTLEHDRIIDGHAPLLCGKELNAYTAAGIRSDHECSNIAEAKEKLSRGQWIMIREGTAAKNLQELMPLFEAPYYNRILLVTDDKHPLDLLNDGHIDAIIRKAVHLGADPIRAIKAGSLNAATYFGLRDTGAIAPGYDADIVVLNDLTDLHVQEVYKQGTLISERGQITTAVNSNTDSIPERVIHSFHVEKITPAQLVIPKQGGHIHVIELHAGELLTSERTASWNTDTSAKDWADGINPDDDIIKIVAIERHKNTGHLGKGFLGGYGLKKGAVATSIGHDSHNLVVAGTNDTDIAIAANAVIEAEGGLAIACQGELKHTLPLPIAGLMSDQPLEQVNTELETMKKTLHDWGIPMDIDPFMTLSFVSLPVIPALRLNTYGLIDVNSHKVVDASFS